MILPTTTTTTTMAVNTNSLLNYWPINNDVQDYAGSSSMTCYSGTSFVADRKNNTNSALFLSGGYCSVPPGIYFYGGDFTILVWVNLQSYTSNTVILDFGCSPSGDSIAPFLPVGSTQGQIQFDILKGSSVIYAYNSAASLSLNRWYHLGFVLNGTTAYTYVNGVLDSYQNGSSTPNYVNRTRSNFGKTTYSSNNLNAYLDDIKIYNRSLSATEIYSDYTS